MTKIACIIPARLQSTRFPRKILAPLHGKPLIEWVWLAAQKSTLFHSVTLAIDSEETAKVVQQFGGRYHMTSPDCANGTMRLCALLDLFPIEGDIFVCWQGDEPFLKQAMIEDLLQTAGHDGADIWTLKKKIPPSAATSSHHVKVVTDHEGYALYFSRSQIPFHRDCLATDYDQHIGVYAYTRAALEKIKSLPPSALAEKEQLEMLNFMYYGLKIKVHETVHESLGIDIPEHLEMAHQQLHLLPSTSS
ncbi:MAG: 3-deoxy-manno-octulosonate cytidylyltransferase [Candidatus Rhabdochlamydia sp.]